MSNFPVYSACDLISTENSESEIVVHELQDLLTEKSFIPEKPHRHTFHQILYVEEGAGIHKIDFEDYSIDSPIIYFISAGQVHDLHFKQQVTKGYLINFNAEFFTSFLAKSHCIDKLPFFRINGNFISYQIKKDKAEELKEIFDKINFEYKQQKRKSEDLIRIYLLELFYFILNDEVNTDENINITNQRILINKFQKLVEENYTAEHYPKFYADKLAITANYLNFVCRTFAGKKAGEIIRNRIILEAKRLLINSELSISQISFQLGFEDNSYFTKFFKTHARISPSEFRQHLNK